MMSIPELEANIEELKNLDKEQRGRIADLQQNLNELREQLQVARPAQAVTQISNPSRR